MLAAAGATEPPTSVPSLTPSAPVVDRRAPRRASTRVVVVVASGWSCCPRVFTLPVPTRPRARPAPAHVRLGAWVEGMTLEPARLDALGRELRTDIEVASYYWGYGDVFPAAPELAHSRGGTRDVLLSWDMGETRFVEWSRGDHDAYLDQIAAAALAYPYDVYVRPWPEMNGDWQSFQPTRDGGQGPRRYAGRVRRRLAARRRPPPRGRGRQHQVGLQPHRRHLRRDHQGLRHLARRRVRRRARPRRLQLGPGLGLGSLALLHRRLREAVPAAHPAAPHGSGVDLRGRLEGAATPGRCAARPRRSKARWITDMMSARAFPRIDTVVWFNEAKERDWRIESSRGSLRAMRRALR